MRPVAQRRIALRQLTVDPRPRLMLVVRSLRGRHLFVLDALTVSGATWLAISVPREHMSSMADLTEVWPALAVPLVAQLLVNVRFGLYRRLWVHASVPDLAQILLAGITGAAVAFLTVAGLGSLATAPGHPLTRSFWLLEPTFAIAGLCAVRLTIRAVSDLSMSSRVAGSRVALVPSLLYGAGEEGVVVARSARHTPRAGIVPVGFLDPDGSQRGATISGLHVYGGIEDLDRAVRQTGARCLLITRSSATGREIREVMAKAAQAGLQVRRIPGFHELLDGSLSATRARKVKVEDLLSRAPVTVHATGVAEAIEGQVVMVTGAAGSIGSELARQIHALGPRRLVLVDRAESPLYMIERELAERDRQATGSVELAVILGNTVNRSLMARIVARERPSVIFHAAAYKHVPMMEGHPSESVQVNVGGTMSVLDAAVAAGVPRFVLVSTDKAVEPSSVMGGTKRLAEWLVAQAAAETGRAYVSVRFGNVLGSSGSVLPIFEHQLEVGEPLTVTDEAMTRFFMTIQEAGWLILDAAAIGSAGDLFVLDMGEPVRIMDLARDVIRLSGREVEEVPIRVTGLRRGEKLQEKLFYDFESVTGTEIDKILRVVDLARPLDIRRVALRLIRMAHGDRDDELRVALFAAIEPAQASRSARGRGRSGVPWEPQGFPRMPAARSLGPDVPYQRPRTPPSGVSDSANGVTPARSDAGDGLTVSARVDS